MRDLRKYASDEWHFKARDGHGEMETDRRSHHKDATKIHITQRPSIRGSTVALVNVLRDALCGYGVSLGTPHGASVVLVAPLDLQTASPAETTRGRGLYDRPTANESSRLSTNNIVSAW